MWQVTVVCPGARRCNVKVTPNTVLLQVLEQACTRQKLDPSLFILKYHGKQVDLSLSMRFSGIPNNGKVELVETDHPRLADGVVVVAVQNENGTRVQSSFHSTTTLWDVLTQHKLDSGPSDTEPCLSFMRQEISGEAALKSTQLRAIGLSTGRGILRFSRRKKAKEDDDDGKDRTPSRVHSREDKEMETDPGEGGGRGREEESNRNDEINDEQPRKKPLQTTVAMYTAEKEEELPYFPAHPINYFTGGIMTGSISDKPENNSISHFPAAGTGGSLPQTLSDFPPEVVAAQLEEVATSNFAGVLRPHPLAPPLSQPQPKVYDESCDRERVVYSLDDPLPLPPQDDVSDQFFEHTVNDIHIMHSDLKKQATVSDAPLMTSAMRAVREEMKLIKYKKCIVRVYFTDRWVLQGCFRPRESLKMLVNFIRENLSDPKVKFHLYTTPPKTVLKSGKVTFAEAGFVPAAVVYIGVEDDSKPHPHLSDSALEQAVSSLQAEINQSQLRTHSISEVTSLTPLSGPSHQPNHLSLQATSLTGPSSVPRTGGGGGGGGGGASVDSSGTRGTKLPKWFKPGSK